MAGKAEVVDHIVASVDGLTKKQAGEAMEAVFACITSHLANGDKVQVPGFGNFVTSQRAERQGRNPATGEAITIAASTNVRLKPAKALKDAVNS